MEACDLSWDEPPPGTLQAKWKCWERSLPQMVQIPRSVTAHQEDIKAIDLHAFRDASQKEFLQLHTPLFLESQASIKH